MLRLKIQVNLFFLFLFFKSQKADFEVSPYFSMTFLQAVSNLEKEGTSICLIAHA